MSLNIFECPYADCNMLFIIDKKDINCGIFRCGYYKNNYQQLHPHTTKDKRDILIQHDLIIGCGQPFMIQKENNIYKLVECGYI
jgi:hypothetical protein